MTTIFGTVVPSSEVNKQLTDDDLLLFVENQESTARQLQDNSSCADELTDCNVNNCMQFWQENFNKFPKLYQLHLKHHCILASSAVTERCFSAAGYIMNAQ